MRYRPFGKTGETISILGLGCGQLPMLPGYAAVDLSAAARLVRHALDNGVNWLDAGLPYAHVPGMQTGPDHESLERFLALALGDGYRRKTNLAARIPARLAVSRHAMERFLDGQLTRLRTDVIDFYCLDGIRRSDWVTLKEGDAAGFLEDARRAGIIRHAGFSVRDTPELFREILAWREWSFCLLQGDSYFSDRRQAGQDGLALAARHGLGVAATSPLLGGVLADGLPEDARAVFRETGSTRSPAAWALRWVWDEAAVAAAVVGMRSLGELEENLRVADEALPGMLTAGERDTIRRAKAALDARKPVPCTGCLQCTCPAGVTIPSVLAAYNSAQVFGETPPALGYGLLSPGERASQCTGCGMCDALCPEHIRIRIQVAKAADYFGDRR